MRVSVIIPTYGMPKYLNKAIESVLNQTMEDLELIIVDDNNPDTDARIRTKELVGKYKSIDKRIQYLCHPQNLNGAVARNTGIAQAKGEYIAFLDSDDEYKPQRLEKCCALMDIGESNIAGVYTGCEFRRGGREYNVINNIQAGNFLVETLACTFMFCTGSNIFVRKSVIDELQGFDVNFLRHQDYEFLVRLFDKYDLAAISDVLVIKNNENLNLPNPEKMISIKKQYLKKFEGMIKNLSEKQQKYIFQSQYIAIAESGMRSGDYEMARRYYKMAKKYGRLNRKTIARRLGFYIKNFEYLIGKGCVS